MRGLSRSQSQQAQAAPSAKVAPTPQVQPADTMHTFALLAQLRRAREGSGYWKPLAQNAITALELSDRFESLTVFEEKGRYSGLAVSVLYRIDDHGLELTVYTCGTWDCRFRSAGGVEREGAQLIKDLWRRELKIASEVGIAICELLHFWSEVMERDAYMLAEAIVYGKRLVAGDWEGWRSRVAAIDSGHPKGVHISWERSQRRGSNLRF